MDIKALNEQLALEQDKAKKVLKEEQNGGYFIYRMIYFENEDVEAEVIEFLEHKGYLVETDYGLTEFSKDDYDRVCLEFDNLPIEDKAKSDGKSALTLDEVKTGLGDIARLFEENKIDLAIRV